MNAPAPWSADPDHPADTDALVVGGGVMGTAAAYYLVRAGVTTVLVERGELNREASGTNAGSLHFQMLRQLDYSPQHLRRIRPALGLYREAARMWPDLPAELAADIELHQGGGVMVAQTPGELETLERKVALECEVGAAVRMISRDEVRGLCPHLSESVLGAAYCPDEGSANPFLVAPAFAAAAARAGALIRTRTEVRAIEAGRDGFLVVTSQGPIHARRVVDVAGSAAPAVAAMAGAKLPVWSRPIQVSVTEAGPPLLDLVIQHVTRRLTLKQSRVGTFLLGGGWPGSASTRDGRTPTTWEGTIGGAWVAASVLPMLRELRIVRTWAGLIPTTPLPMAPLVGEFASVPNFHVIASGVGFTLAPVLGRALADAFMGRKPDVPIDEFRPS